jgi:hypothetical protein
MNIFITILTLFAIALALTMAIPILTFGIAFAFMFGCFFIWLLPILIIASSDKVSGGEKVAWILAIIFLSWFACIFYFLLEPIKEKPRYRECRYS